MPSEDHLGEAERVAAHLPADGNVFQTQFNLVNTRIHAVEISLELGRPKEVTARSELVAVSEIGSLERQAHYWTCMAAGLAMNRKENKAVEALLRADKIAPQHVRNRPIVRNLAPRTHTATKSERWLPEWPWKPDKTSAKDRVGEHS